MKIKILEEKKILILGFGNSGRSVLNFLKNDYQNIDIVDDKLFDEFIYTSKEYLEKIKDVDIIIKSPGINYDIQLLQNFSGEIISDIELAYLYIKENNLNIKLIGVTGTNGKTSTTYLINLILNNSGYKSYSCGNIGVSPLDLLMNKNNIDYLVLELSSYQLMCIKYLKLNYSIFINIDIDHIDFHKTFKNYLLAKSNIILISDICFISKQVQYVLDTYDITYKSEEINIFDSKLLKSNIPMENLNLIYSLLNYIKIDTQIIKDTLINFKGLEHRLERIDSKFDFEIINDSKATNVMATNVAINSMKSPIIIILGGSKKNENYRRINYKNQNLKTIIVYGENKNEFKFIDDAIFVDKLYDAISLSINIASKGDIVLFSPASASFDEFDNYIKRGNYFKKIIKELS